MPILQSDECVNDDSSEDSAGDTCTDWYDAHPEDCRGQYDDEEVAARKYNEYVRRHDLGNQLNDVDANGKPLPTTVKQTSRFWGVSWQASRCKWQAKYSDGSTPSRDVWLGYFVDEERAALAYNEAVIAADLADIRHLNRIDPATGRPLPKDQD